MKFSRENILKSLPDTLDSSFLASYVSFRLASTSSIVICFYLVVSSTPKELFPIPRPVGYRLIAPSGLDLDFESLSG